MSAIARKAGVDRSFFYRSQHKDLLAQIHAAETEPSLSAGAGPVVSRASLKADLANSQERCARLAARRREVERRSATPAPRAAGPPPPPPAEGCADGEPVRPFEVIEQR